MTSCGILTYESFRVALNLLCRSRAIALATTIVALVGCGGRFDIYSPGEIHRTVRSLGSGSYVVYYEWPYVIDSYGPDMKFLLKGVDNKDKPAIWKAATAQAVPKYLEAKGLVPGECARGVSITRSGEGEGGKGWAEFVCK